MWWLFDPTTLLLGISPNKISRVVSVFLLIIRALFTKAMVMKKPAACPPKGEWTHKM